jgi:hypothetical protein
MRFLGHVSYRSRMAKARAVYGGEHKTIVGGEGLKYPETCGARWGKAGDLEAPGASPEARGRHSF